MTMLAPHAAPAWSTQEILDLLGLWGEEAIQAQLRSSCRNVTIYGQIVQQMQEKGCDRDQQQRHVKTKELQQAYQEAQEANNQPGIEPQTCLFHKELHAILDRDPTTTLDNQEVNELELKSSEAESSETNNFAFSFKLTTKENVKTKKAHEDT